MKNEKGAEIKIRETLSCSRETRLSIGCRSPQKSLKLMSHVVDSTTVPLIAKSPDLTKHRRRKAAAKNALAS